MDYAAGGQMWECLAGGMGTNSSLCYVGATDLSASVVASSLMMACTHAKHRKRIINFMPHHLLPMKIEDEMKDACYGCFCECESGRPNAPKKVDSLSFFSACCKHARNCFSQRIDTFGHTAQETNLRGCIVGGTHQRGATKMPFEL